jgi:hypothetical protein
VDTYSLLVWPPYIHTNYCFLIIVVIIIISVFIVSNSIISFRTNIKLTVITAVWNLRSVLMCNYLNYFTVLIKPPAILYNIY